MSVIELQQQPSLLVITSPVEKVIGGASALPPIGPAGGDLAGTYPNPTIRDGAVVLADIADGSVTDAKVAAGAAIAYSKLNLAASIVNADVAAGAAIARSKLDFGAGLVNADIAAGAAIAASKLGPLSPLTLSSTAIGQTPLIARGFAGQTADLQQWQDSATTVLVNVSATGHLVARRDAAFGNVTGPFPSTTVGIKQRNGTDVGFAVQQAAGGSADLQQWQTSAPTTVASIGSAGAALFAALQVTGGSYRVDSAGRTSFGTGANPLGDRFFDVGGSTSHPGTGTGVRGLVVNYTSPATATSLSQNYYGQSRTAAAAFTLGTASVFYADTPTLGAGSSIGTTVGLYVENQGRAGVTQALGVYVAPQSTAATSVGVRVDTATTAALWLGADAAGTTVAGGIAFGSGRDVSVFRSGASELNVNGSLRVDTNGRIGVNGSIAATRLIYASTTNHPNAGVSIYGAHLEPMIPATATTLYAGYTATIRTAAAPFTLASAIGFQVESPVYGAGSTVNDVRGVFVANQGGANAVTAYGVWISSQSGATNTNLPLVIASVSTFAVNSQGRVFLNTAIDNSAYINNDVSSHPSTTTIVRGAIFRYTAPATATSENTVIYSEVRTASAAFTQSNAYNFRAVVPTIGPGSTITSLHGLHVANQGATGVTNAYGALIAAQTGAATLNVGARIDTSTTAALWLGGDAAGTTVSGGIAFGSGRDVNLYRSAAVVLRTDSNFRGLSIGAGPAGSTRWSAIEENSGGVQTFDKSTAAAANPGAGSIKVYARDGTNVNTLKLVARAGAAGAETTILDNIPT